MDDVSVPNPKGFETRRDSERHNVFSMLPALYAASRRQGQNLLKEGGDLSIMEWRVLWDLVEVGPLTVQQLAQLQKADHSLLSRALPEIRKRGLVTMTRGPSDKRQMVVEITEKGRAAQARAAPIMRKRRERVRALFTAEEMAEFVGYLDRLDAFLRMPIAQILEQETSE